MCGVRPESSEDRLGPAALKLNPRSLQAARNGGNKLSKTGALASSSMRALSGFSLVTYRDASRVGQDGAKLPHIRRPPFSIARICLALAHTQSAHTGVRIDARRRHRSITAGNSNGVLEDVGIMLVQEGFPSQNLPPSFRTSAEVEEKKHRVLSEVGL